MALSMRPRNRVMEVHRRSLFSWVSLLQRYQESLEHPLLYLVPFKLRARVVELCMLNWMIGRNFLCVDFLGGAGPEIRSIEDNI